MPEKKDVRNDPELSDTTDTLKDIGKTSEETREKIRRSQRTKMKTDMISRNTLIG